MDEEIKDPINIKDTKFLEIINRKLKRGDFFPEIGEDLLSLSETAMISMENIQELMTYLSFAATSNDHYYDGLKHLVLIEKTSIGKAFKKIDKEKNENDYLYEEILRFFAPDVFEDEEAAQ